MTGGHSLSIFVSTMPFGEFDSSPVEWLAATGWTVKVNDTGRKLKPSEVAEMARDCDGIVAGTENLDELVATSTRLKMISRVGIGLDSVPLMKCRERGIAVAYTPDAVTLAVAEFTIGSMISTCRYFVYDDRTLRAGQWKRTQGLRLGEAKIGIVGFGRIGSNVGRMLAPFRPKEVLVRDIQDKSAGIAALVASGVNARAAGFDEILETCDIVTLHVPLGRATRGLIGAAQLRRMRHGAYLINASRGGIVDEAALYDVLKSGHLAGAAVDVFETEPYTGPFCELENVQLTAHLGSCSVDCRARMECEATADLVRFFKGETMHNPVPDDEYENQG